MLNVYGVGLLTPWGHDELALFEMLNGARGNLDFLNAQGEVKYLTIDNYSPEKYFDEKQLHNLDRNSTLVIGAAKFAFENAKYQWGEDGQRSIGVVVGSAHSIATSMSDFEESVIKDGIRRSRIGIFPNTVMCAPASRVSIVEKIKGANTTIASGFNSGIDAIGCAKLAVNNGVVDLMLVGGSDAYSEKIWQGLVQERMICSAEELGNLDSSNSKFVPAESACALLVGDSRRSEPSLSPQCRITAFANSFSVCKRRKSSDRAQDLVDIIKIALSEAKIRVQDVDFVIASGYFDKLLSKVEDEALATLNFSLQVPVLRPKILIGETFAAQGLLAIVVSIGVMRGSIHPETIRKMRVGQGKYSTEVSNSKKKCLILQVDPSGHNSVVVVNKTEEGISGQ